MSDKVLIAASLLSADMARFERSMSEVASEVDYFHCDVMDGHFVPNLTFGAPVVKAIKRISTLPLDVHLMIEKPASWIDDYIGAGLSSKDYLTFHIEAEPNPVNALKKIQDAGIQAGIVVKPGTAATAIKGLEKFVNQVLVMTVEPGFGGQKFKEEMLPKITEIRKMFPDNVLVAVDGGIDETTAPLVYEAGASLLIAGNAIFGKPDPRNAARNIRFSANPNHFVC